MAAWMSAEEAERGYRRAAEAGRWLRRAAGRGGSTGHDEAG
jgi:hypothetical protein